MEGPFATRRGCTNRSIALSLLRIMTDIIQRIRAHLDEYPLGASTEQLLRDCETALLAQAKNTKGKRAPRPIDTGISLPDEVEWTRVRGALAMFLSGLSSNIPGGRKTARYWEAFIDEQLADHGTIKALRDHLSTPMTYLANCDDEEFERRVDAFMAGEPFIPAEPAAQPSERKA